MYSFNLKEDPFPLYSFSTFSRRRLGIEKGNYYDNSGHWPFLFAKRKRFRKTKLIQSR